jgi:hypothetical protein
MNCSGTEPDYFRNYSIIKKNYSHFLNADDTEVKCKAIPYTGLDRSLAPEGSDSQNLKTVGT